MRSHITFRPRSSTFFTLLPTKEEEMKEIACRSRNYEMNNTIYLRGPMKTVINMTTRKDGDKNQKFTNTN